MFFIIIHMSYTITSLKDEDYFEMDYIQENGFVNATRLCDFYQKDLGVWKEAHYEELFNALEAFCMDHRLTGYHTLDYKGNMFIDPALAFHLAYWIGPDVGVRFCALFFQHCPCAKK